MHAGQRLDAVALRVQFGAAALERLFDDDTQTGNGGAGLFDDRDQRLRGLTVGQEVVDDQHAVAAGQVARGDGHGAFGLLGERVDGRREQVFSQGQRLLLAGEDHRHAEVQTGHDRRGDARGFDGDDLGDPRILEERGEFVTDQLHQGRVDLVVQESVDFQDLIGKHDAFFADFFVQCFHNSFLCWRDGRRR